jgi:hypothetical protein
MRLPCATHRNIYVRSRRAGERVKASVSRFLTTKLRLKVNEAKSAVARPEKRKFLGFSISNDGSERRIAPKALGRFKTQIRDLTSRTRGISLLQLIKELLRGDVSQFNDLTADPEEAESQSAGFDRPGAGSQ